ncbi:MAG: HAMP domain-containing protein [Pseudonocardiales bacterium]
MRLLRGTLAQRISLLAVAVAVIAALVAGTLTFTLVRQSGERSARQTLSRLADAAQATGESAASAQAGQQRARQLLNALRVQFVTVRRSGAVSGNLLAKQALKPTDIPRLLAGSPISDSRTVAGQVVLIEARPTLIGGIVLVQPRSDALASGNAAIRRTAVALVIAAGIAVLLGLAVAWQLGRPLRRTAQAAHELAGGRRDVVLSPEGPAEVAEVSAALNTLAAALAQAETRQRDFLLSVSHDLRTPLTSITGFA